MIRSECIRNASVTLRNTEYTKYDPPGAQVSDDALAQKYLLYTPPARLKLRYRSLRAYFFRANRPSTNDVLEHLLEVINHTFDFCKKISINMELLQSNAAQMATYGITIGVPQLVLTLLADIKTVMKSKYGHEFSSTMHAIQKKDTYNHVHDAASLQTILMKLAGQQGDTCPHCKKFQRRKPHCVDLDKCMWNKKY